MLDGSPRARLADAALELFFRRGFEVTTVREVTMACGLTAGAMYNHFASKDDLLVHVVEQAHDELDRRLREALGLPAATHTDRLRALVEAFTVFHTLFRKEALVANREYPSLPDAPRRRIIERRRAVRQVFADLLCRGRDDGEFSFPDDDVEVTTTAILDMGIAVAQWFRPDGRLTNDEVAARHAELARRMVAG